jgi:hypothetical protein
MIAFFALIVWICEKKHSRIRIRLRDEVGLFNRKEWL